MESENKDPYYYIDIGVVHISYGDSNGHDGTIFQNSTADCKYLLFIQDLFFRLKPKQYQKCQFS